MIHSMEPVKTGCAFLTSSAHFLWCRTATSVALTFASKHESTAQPTKSNVLSSSWTRELKSAPFSNLRCIVATLISRTLVTEDVDMEHAESMWVVTLEGVRNEPDVRSVTLCAT